MNTATKAGKFRRQNNELVNLKIKRIPRRMWKPEYVKYL